VRAERAPHSTCVYDEAFEIVPLAARSPGLSARVSAILAARAKDFRDGLREELKYACEEGIPADVRASLDARCEVPFASVELVSVACKGYLFVGGAHGTKSSWTMNLDLASARELRLDDLFRPRTSWRKGLDRLATAAFDRADASPFDQDIPAMGTFVVTRPGLRFYTENSLPFVLGGVDPLVAWSALRRYLRPQWLRLFLRHPRSWRLRRGRWISTPPRIQ
jgi:hypothetical protein